MKCLSRLLAMPTTSPRLACNALTLLTSISHRSFGSEDITFPWISACCAPHLGWPNSGQCRIGKVKNHLKETLFFLRKWQLFGYSPFTNNPFGGRSILENFTAPRIRTLNWFNSFSHGYMGYSHSQVTNLRQQSLLSCFKKQRLRFLIYRRYMKNRLDGNIISTSKTGHHLLWWLSRNASIEIGNCTTFWCSWNKHRSENHRTCIAKNYPWLLVNPMLSHVKKYCVKTFRRASSDDCSPQLGSNFWHISGVSKNTLAAKHVHIKISGSNQFVSCFVIKMNDYEPHV